MRVHVHVELLIYIFDQWKIVIFMDVYDILLYVLVTGTLNCD